MNQKYLLKSMSDLAQCRMKEESFLGPASDLPPPVFTPQGLGLC